MDTPPCFGNVNVSRGSPCHACRVIGPCVEKFNKTQEFGVLLWPRIAPPPTVEARGLPNVAAIADEVMAKLATAFEEVSLKLTSRARRRWRLGTTAVLDVREAALARTTIVLWDVPPNRVAQFPAATMGVQLNPVYDVPPAAPGARVTVGTIKRQKIHASATIAASASPEVIGMLVQQVTRGVHYLRQE